MPWPLGKTRVSPIRAIVSVSSGAGSAYAWHLAIEKYGHENVTGVFCDVNGEHPDNYRFLAEITRHLDARCIKLHNDGLTIWDTFKMSRFLGNSRIDPCSRILKREAIKRWLEANCDPADTVVILGLDWTEMHRVDRNRAAWAKLGWQTEFPLADTTTDKGDVLDWLRAIGVKAPILYELGFAHANCGGGCVKAGIKQFKHLLKTLPDEYARWEAHEEEIRVYLGRDDVAILTDRRGGVRKPMTLRQLREEIEASPTQTLFDDEEWGACGCFTEEGEAA